MDSTTYKTEVTKAFNAAAASYDRLGVDFFTPMGRRLVERSRIGPGDRVLDVGCGCGAALFPAAEQVGPSGHVLGIDIAQSMVEEVAAEARRRGLRNVEAKTMDGEAPDLPARSVDGVLGSYSLIFLPDARGALRRYAALLRPGGRLAFTSPVFAKDTFPFLPPLFTELIPRSLLEGMPKHWQPEEIQRRFNSWLGDPHVLSETLERAGFTDVDIVDEEVDMVAASGQAWVDWSHTQGMRLLWQHLSPADASWLRARLTTALDAMRVGSSPLTIPVPVRFVTAVGVSGGGAGG